MCEKIYDARMIELIYKVHFELVPTNIHDEESCHGKRLDWMKRLNWMKWLDWMTRIN